MYASIQGLRIPYLIPLILIENLFRGKMNKQLQILKLEITSVRLVVGVDSINPTKCNSQLKK